MQRQVRQTILSIVLVAAMLLQSILASLPATQQTSATTSSFQPSVAWAQNESNSVYLPVVVGGSTTTTVAPPQFEISSPISGSIVSRVFNFAIQPLTSDPISDVTFKTSSSSLGSDNTSSDGFRLFVDAGNLVTGTLQLIATAKGPGGETSKTVTVSVLPHPPASATVGTESSVLATDLGSTISILPNSLPAGATVSISELTQDQVTSQTGIRWDDIGVTFLGAQEIKSSAPFSRPLGSVVSAGFGNRVQPGQAVVNYRLGPDVDGDGAGEIVVVNTASVAPNGDVVGDTNSLPTIQSVVTISGTSHTSRFVNMIDSITDIESASEVINASLGSVLEISVDGLNPLSIYGNTAVWQNIPNVTETLDIPVFSYIDRETFKHRLIIPVIGLPKGLSELVIRDEVKGNASKAIKVSITPNSVSEISARETLNNLMTQIKQDLQNSSSSQQITDTVKQIHQAQADLNDIFDLIDSLDEGKSKNALNQQLLDVGTAVQIIYDNYRTKSIILSANLSEHQDLGLLSAGIGVLGPALQSIGKGMLKNITGDFLSTGFSHLTGIASGLIKLGRFLGWVGFALALYDLCTYFDCLRKLACLLYSNNSGNITGMGSAPPPGGNGCGGIGGGGDGSAILASSVSGTSPFDMEPGRYHIKVYRRDFSGNPLSPFTGVNDAGGYFFLPLIPQDEPFTAVAVDKQTGLAVTYDGIGPKEGTSTFMFFDFSDQKRTAFPIHIGDTISANVPISGAGRIEWPGTIDVYTFTASAGQFISFTLQSADFSLTPLRVRLQSPSGNTLVDTRFATGTSKNFFLPQAGDYTLTINEIEGRSKGEYQFTTFKLPVELFGIAIGDTIANHSPAAGAGNIETIGAKDIYTFSVPARQRLFFNLLDVTAVPNITWQLVDSSDTILFENPFSFGDPGVRTLVNGGIYTLTVGTTNIQTGTYSFKIWNVPDPQQFAISVGSTVSDGLPASGAGKIETPGTKDQYTFTASAGQHIYFDLITGLENIPWKAVDAKGSVIFEGNLTDGDPGERTLSQGGTYTITVGSDFQATTGSYSFQIRNP